MRYEDVVRSVVTGDHPDPFSFLGMHPAEDGFVVRTFLPGARAVEVVSAGGALGELECIHPERLFTGPVTVEERIPYRLRVTWEGGGEAEIEDPYRFPHVLGEQDLYLLGEGNHFGLYKKLGAHPMELEGIAGTNFAVWAPNARRVSVVGDFNFWDGRRHVMRKRSGVWEIFLPGVGEGTLYMYEIKGPSGELLALKADPLGFQAQKPPGTASVISEVGCYEWSDAEWMEDRAERNGLDASIAIYEVHLGSWRRNDDGSYYTYGQLADELVPYVAEMGYTHVEFLPPTEHPFDGSWGYQPLGLFAPTSRFGTPDGFKRLVDAFHRMGIGVIMDWVPAHFPEDPHGLGFFDGTHLYERADPQQGKHPDWDTLIFDYERNEVRNYLISNAIFWLSEYHIDGLRVDAVASMLYLDYSREAGEWIPNEYGGNEDLEAVAFIKRLNEVTSAEHPGTTMAAEESTTWPMVSRPTSMGGLGFDYKWNMGWMNDTLNYMSEEPIHRSHDTLTFSLVYAFSENFVLPLSHDEVVHGKRSLINKMPGDGWQRFANLRLYYAFMYGHPGKQLLFMGGEFAQKREWNHDTALDWDLLENPMHRGVQTLLIDLNALYRSSPALYEVDFESAGFEWIEVGDRERSVVSFLRRARDPDDFLVVVCNFAPVAHHAYRMGVPVRGRYAEVLNTDDPRYGGRGAGNGKGVSTQEAHVHGHPYSLSLILPPLTAMVLKPVG